MKINLIRASLKDTKEIWEMQVKSFGELLDKYQDFETNPASEPISNIEMRLKQNFTFPPKRSYLCRRSFYVLWFSINIDFI